MNCRILFFLLLPLGTVSQMVQMTSNIRLVDYYPPTGNFIFRGPDPSNSTDGFDYTAMVGYFKTVAANAGIPFPAKFYIVDFSFWTTEASSIAAEQLFWQRHPTLGKVVNWPLYGVLDPMVYAGCTSNNVINCPSSQPADFATSDARMMYKHYLEWGDYGINGSALTRGLAAARRWLTSSLNPVPTIIYGHCTCGCDRTGSFMGSYYMQFLNFSYSETIRYSETIPNRPLDYPFQLHLQWYCGFLYASDPVTYSQLTDCNNSCL